MRSSDRNLNSLATIANNLLLPLPPIWGEGYIISRQDKPTRPVATIAIPNPSGIGWAFAEFNTPATTTLVLPEEIGTSYAHTLRLGIHTDDETMEQAQELFKTLGKSAFFMTEFHLSELGDHLLVHAAPPEIYPYNIRASHYCVKFSHLPLSPRKMELFGMTYEECIAKLENATEIAKSIP